MKQNRSTVAILLLLYVAVLALPFALRPETAAVAATETLRIYSPHPENIRVEFARGFNDSRAERGLPLVHIEWLDAGGTSRIIQAIRGKFVQSRGEGIGDDIMFGGGDFPYLQLIRGITLPSGETVAPLLEAIELPEEIIGPIPHDFAGFRLYNEDGLWHGAVISGFGIMFNRVALERIGVDPPVVWADLANPKLFGWVAAADPGASGSMHMMFEIILQAYGFERGFDILARMGGNSRYFSEGANTVVRDVALGDVAVGCAIDFYADTAIGSYGSDRLGFAYPQGETIFNPDAIGVLKGAPNRETAIDFVRYVLSPEGQKLWLLRKGAEGGPQRFDLYRKPILPSAYDTDSTQWVVQGNPYEMTPGFIFDSGLSGRRWTAVNMLIQSAMIDNAAALRRAWKRLIDSGLPEAGVAEFGRPVVSEEELMEMIASERWRNDPAYRTRIRTDWTNAFRAKYHRIANTDWEVAP